MKAIILISFLICSWAQAGIIDSYSEEIPTDSDVCYITIPNVDHNQAYAACYNIVENKYTKIFYAYLVDTDNMIFTDKLVHVELALKSKNYRLIGEQCTTNRNGAVCKFVPNN